MKIEYKSEAEIRAEENLLHNASFDAVTGIFNRQHFDKLAQAEVTCACKYKTPIGAILLDIDNFKQINDSYGHQCGDFVLAKFADVVTEVTDGLRKAGPNRLFTDERDGTEAAK